MITSVIKDLTLQEKLNGQEGPQAPSERSSFTSEVKFFITRVNID